MEMDALQSILTTAQSVTVIGVLLAWLWREMRARDKLSQEILDDYRDLKSKRLSKYDAEASEDLHEIGK